MYVENLSGSNEPVNSHEGHGWRCEGSSTNKLTHLAKWISSVWKIQKEAAIIEPKASPKPGHGVMIANNESDTGSKSMLKTIKSFSTHYISFVCIVYQWLTCFPEGRTSCQTVHVKRNDTDVIFTSKNNA